MQWFENNMAITWAIPMALVVLVLALWLLVRTIEGAVALFLFFFAFAFALNQGFVGLVAFVVAWVFLFPFMLAVSILLGLLIYFADRYEKYYEKKQAKQVYRYQTAAKKWRQKHPREGAYPLPPPNPSERHKWANRLPPYDE